MHIETLSYMFHWLPFEMKKELSSRIPDPQPRPKPQKTRVPAGDAKVGMNRADGRAFGWDNEFEGYMVNVPEFEIDVYKVSNGEFMEFVEAGGYEESSFWNQADWKWIHSKGIRHPQFWVKRGDEWGYRAMFAEIP